LSEHHPEHIANIAEVVPVFGGYVYEAVIEDKGEHQTKIYGREGILLLEETEKPSKRMKRNGYSQLCATGQLQVTDGPFSLLQVQIEKKELMLELPPVQGLSQKVDRAVGSARSYTIKFHPVYIRHGKVQHQVLLIGFIEYLEFYPMDTPVDTEIWDLDPALFEKLRPGKNFP